MGLLFLILFSCVTLCVTKILTYPQLFKRCDYSMQIIKDGYSCIYKKAKYPKELDDILQGAKESKKGLWSFYFEIMSRLCK